MHPTQGLQLAEAAQSLWEHLHDSASSELEPYGYAEETAGQRDARMAWWRDAKFGMFIHWGVYAVPAGTHDGKRVNGFSA